MEEGTKKNRKLNVLHLEDSLPDFEIIGELLKDGGYDLTAYRVETEEELVLALTRGGYDIILADFKLPGFDGLAALRLSVEICPYIPFICVSGSIGEETATELIKQGAVDYVLKDRLERLPFAIRRALDEAEEKNARRRAETAVQESEARYRSIFENAVEGIFQASPEGQFIAVNPAMARIHGFTSPEEMIAGMADSEGHLYVDLRDRERYAGALKAKGVVNNFEARMFRKDGTIIWTSTNARAVRNGEGRISHFDGTVEDITSRKRADEQLKNSLREKEVLLKEIHHRVKNNLQVMSSLLNLQSQYLSDPKAKDILRTSMDRIKSMAFMHDKLCMSENLSSILFPEYVKDLTHSLVSTYATGREIILTLDITPVSFDIDTAMPLGLAINELVSNALKHAFPEKKEECIVAIDLSRDDTVMTLVISDNGIGFPENIDFADTQSLGMQLVTTLVDQLEGTIELTRGEGTEFKITFDIAE